MRRLRSSRTNLQETYLCNGAHPQQAGRMRNRLFDESRLRDRPGGDASGAIATLGR